jgi:hypothetical protein
VELHPWLAQREIRRYDDANRIRLTASVLGFAVRFAVLAAI